MKLSKVVPWDLVTEIYRGVMDKDRGRLGLSPRIVLGTLIIKHLKKLNDHGTIEEIEEIQENPHMQYFLGLEEFIIEPVFDPSLFVEIRKRIGKDDPKHNLKSIKKAKKIMREIRCLKERNIRITARPFDRPVKQPTENYYEKIYFSRYFGLERKYIQRVFSLKKDRFYWSLNFVI